MTELTAPRIEFGDRAIVKNPDGQEREVRVLFVKEDTEGRVRHFVGRESYGPDVTVTLVYTPEKLIRLYKS